MQFGERLKMNRKNSNLTQDDVANEFNVSRQTISSWENENSYPDIDSLIKLSDFYEISLDTLLKEDQGMTNHIKYKDYINRINFVLMFLFFIMGSVFICLQVTLIYFDNFYLSISMLSVEFLLVILINLIKKYRTKFLEEHNLTADYYNESKFLKCGSENVGKIIFIFGISLPIYSEYAKLDMIELIIFLIINLWGISSSSVVVFFQQ